MFSNSPFRHCERSDLSAETQRAKAEAIHPSFALLDGLRRHARNNVETDAPSRSRGAMRPSFDKDLVPRKWRGAGKAGYTLYPRSHVRCASKNAAHEHTGSAEALRLSLRNGLTAYAVLTPATNSVIVTVADGLRLIEPGWANFASASLTSATDARPTRFCRTQQPRLRLTASPGTPDSFRKLRLGVGAVRLHEGDRSQAKPPPCNSRPRRRCRVHRSPPRVSDDPDTPLMWDGMAEFYA
jgi:hypothetical protein